MYRIPPQKRHPPFSTRIGRVPSTRTSDARPYGCGWERGATEIFCNLTGRAGAM